jgi:chorismate mutase
MPTLDDLRRDIDRVDEVLVRLLNERARCACEIGRLKKERGMEVYQPEREKQVLAHVRAVACEGPLGPDAIARLFERIIDEARRLERYIVHDGGGDQDPPEDSRPGGARPSQAIAPGSVGPSDPARAAKHRTGSERGPASGE